MNHDETLSIKSSELFRRNWDGLNTKRAWKTMDREERARGTAQPPSRALAPSLIRERIQSRIVMQSQNSGFGQTTLSLKVPRSLPDADEIHASCGSGTSAEKPHPRAPLPEDNVDPGCHVAIGPSGDSGTPAAGSRKVRLTAHVMCSAATKARGHNRHRKVSLSRGKVQDEMSLILLILVFSFLLVSQLKPGYCKSPPERLLLAPVRRVQRWEGGTAPKNGEVRTLAVSSIPSRKCREAAHHVPRRRSANRVRQGKQFSIHAHHAVSSE